MKKIITLFSLLIISLSTVTRQGFATLLPNNIINIETTTTEPNFAADRERNIQNNRIIGQNCAAEDNDATNKILKDKKHPKLNTTKTKYKKVKDNYGIKCGNAFCLCSAYECSEGFTLEISDGKLGTDERLSYCKKAKRSDTGAKTLDEKLAQDSQTEEEDEDVDDENDEEKKKKGIDKDKANATLEAASMASMGLGAMEAAQALSEKKSDAAAETDMTAYLATMRCEWGKGGTSKLSTEDIDVGAGNELINYASEYKTLAARLKKTKTALNLTPGIESEEILDKASAGLYEYTPAERSSGAYASLSKALRDENSIDAQKWAEQKDTTKKRLIAGAAVAGAGLVASVVGNQIINKDGNRKTASTAENIATLTDNNYFKEYLDE